MKTYFSHGKVLLAGEYTVTAGLEALAFPTKKGQWLQVWEMDVEGGNQLHWQALDADRKEWFGAVVDTDRMESIENTDENIVKTLIYLLKAIKEFKPELFLNKTLRMETLNEFSRDHGLGTSSTLVCNLALWSSIDPFVLQKQVFGGSGYDIAVCSTGKPVIYWLEDAEPSWQPLRWDPKWSKGWRLVFPGKKKNSRDAIKETTERIRLATTNPIFRFQLSQILQGLKAPGNRMMLEAGLEMWQGMISNLLGLKRVYDDYQMIPVAGGMCKYLGAWGGDVFLVNDLYFSLNQNKIGKMHSVLWDDFIIMDNEVN